MNKQTVNINFSGGLDTKTDPFQVQAGKFLSLVNNVFSKGGKLTKRNGFGSISTLPSPSYTALTTLSDALTALGPSGVAQLSQASEQWTQSGNYYPCSVSALPMIRNSNSQIQVDSAVSESGVVCSVFTESVAGSIVYYYSLTNSVTGQSIISPTLISTLCASGVVTGSQRVFLLAGYFIIVFTNVISAISHLQYAAINALTGAVVKMNTDLAASYTPSSTTSNLNWDGVVSNGHLYVSYNGIGSTTVKIVYLTSSLALSSTKSFTSTSAELLMSVTSDESQSVPTIWASYLDASGNVWAYGVDAYLNTILAPSNLFTAGATSPNITIAAQDGILSIFTEIINHYSFDTSIPNNTVLMSTYTQGGVYTSIGYLCREIGLASKAFIVDGMIYCLVATQSQYQSTYFLINASTSLDSSPVVIAKLAYENGGGYLSSGLPSVSVNGDQAQVPYLFKDLVEALTTVQNSQQTTTGGIYSQTGINLASITFNSEAGSNELAQTLQMQGGFLWEFDGLLPAEHNFFLWPELTLNQDGTYHGISAATVGGAMSQYIPGSSSVLNQYSYQVTYEWTDSKGNTHRSAPSIPVTISILSGSAITTHSVFSSGATSITVASATGLAIGQVITDTTTSGNITAGTYITYVSGTTIGLSQPTAGASASSPGDVISTTQTASVTLKIPTLRLTYKISSPPRICVYRWSTAQQNYHMVTSVTVPLLNSTTSEFVTFVDTQSDVAIQGNALIYTTGGVLENVNAPASSLMTLFDNRLWLIDSEDPSLAWFSKPVVQGVPVEMSDLQTMFIAPTQGAQGSTGPNTACAPMDDKIIFFKQNAIYYVNGTGPDSTGANSAYSQPIFVTSAVGCSNQRSIVFMPKGIMFQSSQGIWLLGRDGMSTDYIGADVEQFNSSTITSAVNVPGENQVRFTLNTGETLCYDYFYNQWSTFETQSSRIPTIDSCIYQGLHTRVDSNGIVTQETPGIYLDGSVPVVSQFTSSWIKPGNIQGFGRLYWLSVLGSYFSPHKLQISVAYDYKDDSSSVIYSPGNFVGPYGTYPIFGDGSFGGTSLENFRVFASQQKCQSFRVSIQEIYDPQFGSFAGEGLSLTGLQAVVGVSRNYRPFKSTGTSVGLS
jgi:hypothetical protein